MSRLIGPVALRVRSRDLPRASTLYQDALGGDQLDRHDAGRRWWLGPGLVADLVVDADPGPEAVIVAVDTLDATIAILTRHAVDHVRTTDRVVVTDPRIAAGHLEFVPLDHELAATAATARTARVGSVGVDAFDHLCLAVSDLVLAIEVLGELGGRPVIGGDSYLGARIVQLRFPHLKLELMQPIGPGPLADFVRRRGGRAGIHHVTLLVHDVLAADAALRAAGLPTVGTDTSSQPSWQETYVRPSAADGLLVQLARTTNHHRTPLTAQQLSDVLAGRYIAYDHAMRRREEVDT